MSDLIDDSPNLRPYFRRWNQPLYYVNIGKWKYHPSGEITNYFAVKNKKLAVKLLKKHPGRYSQIDIRYGGDRNNPPIRCCWMYWHKGRLVEQKITTVKPIYCNEI